MDTYKKLFKEDHSPIWWFCIEWLYVGINCFFCWSCYVLFGRFPTIIFAIITAGAGIELTIVKVIGAYLKLSTNHEQTK